MSNITTNICADSVNQELGRPEFSILYQEMIKRLSNIDINAQDTVGRTSLIYAVQLGDLKIVKQLIKDGADVLYVSPRYGSALHAAAADGNPDMVNLLLKAGAVKIIDAVDSGSTQWCNSTALFRAVTSYNSSINPAFENKDSKDYKLRAANSLRIIRILLENGANPNIQDKGGMTAMHWAAQSGAAPEAVKLFLEFNANVNTKSKNKTTPLMSAAVGDGSIEIVRMLVEAGADINASTKKQNGDTALTLAAYYGHLDIVKYLLDNGADKSAMSNVITKKGETALDVVKKKKFDAILDILT